ncbi:MAG: RagB/SusD family nutrient uptake outer membrane protein [Balneolaceae bacterium]
MNFIRSKTLFVGSFLAILFGFACTDLNEKLPSEVRAEDFFQNETQILSALGEAYVVLAAGGMWGSHNGLWSIHQVSSDETVIPQRGQDWFDGGIWLRMHRHTFNTEEGAFEGAWAELFRGVNTSNRVMFQLEQAVADGVVEPALAGEFIAELRALRAFYYYWLLDTFGNVPIVDDFVNAPANPGNNPDFQTGRTAVFNFVEQELLDVVNLVTDDVAGSRGRINKFGVHFLLGKLYLNAEVYTGQERYSDAIFHFNEIVESGEYSLAPNFFDTFSINNANAVEHIFAIPFDEVFLPGFELNQMTLHYGQQFEFNLQDQPWNGYATLQSFYESFEEDDVRRDGFLTGTRFRQDDGTPIEDPDFEGAPIDDDPELNLRTSINELEPNACRECGARFAKFEIGIGSLPNMSNDFPVFRYADAVLSLAEAEWREGVGTPEMRVNDIRSRYGLDPMTLNSENLLAERGRELYLEMWRRQDLIRFEGTQGPTAFNDEWDFKEVSEQFRTVFPIPRNVRQTNPNLVQNPGYQ